LGILYLASALRDCGCEVQVYDSNACDIEQIPFADVYGFSAVFNTYKSCVKLAGAIRNKHPKSKIIIGGVHPTLDPDNIDVVFDSVFIGEGEETIRDYVTDSRNGGPVRFYRPSKSVNIDNLYPDRSILEDSYIRTHSIFANGLEYDSNGSTAVLFSRGCPYECAFCSSPKLYNRKVRFRSAESILNEITQIIEKYNIRQFRVQDDTFTANTRRLKQITEKLKGLGIYYRCSTRVNHVTDEIVKCLYESGCREIGLGIEVANDEGLRILNKGITVDQAQKAVAVIKRYPIIVRCFFMIGLPFDSQETVKGNIDFIEKNNVDNAVVGNFIPFPGNDMFINMARYNIKAVKENTCMNIGRHLELRPNLLRTDISEAEHMEIMKVFYDYLMEKEFV
jgi:anaerobic magnesium-protoporphyrin IX monomethyl ester cyclase